VADPSEQETVNSWYKIAVSGNLSLEVTELFFRFAALWIAFNGVYTRRFPRNRTTVRSERAQVQAYGRHYNSRHKALLISSPRYADSCKYLAEHGIQNMRDGVRETISSASAVSEVFSALYTIRCNFLHGEKNPGVGRDRSVIEAGVSILSEMLGDEPARKLS
jgi:hypothetical protein